MKYVNLGNSGLKVSEICMGCMSFGSHQWFEWVLEEDAAFPILKKAWDLGINFFDTANIYSNGESEKVLGKFIKEFNIPREEIIVATKVFGPVANSNSEKKPTSIKELQPNTFGLSRKHILHAVENSLKRLGTDYIDLYIIHRWDKDTPIEETMETLHELVKSGKVRYIGASTMYAWQFAKAQHVSEKKGLTKFISMQNLYNLIYREEEREMIPMCIDQKVSITPYAALGQGILARPSEFIHEEKKTEGESKRGSIDASLKQMCEQLTDGDRETLKRVIEIAEKKSATPSQIALAWLLTRPGVACPVLGVTSIAQIESSVAACDIELTKEEVDQLQGTYTPKKVQGMLD